MDFTGATGDQIEAYERGDRQAKRERAIAHHMEEMHGWGALAAADPEAKHDALHATNEGEHESYDSDDHQAAHDDFPPSQPFPRS
jgi:hypothetical protein